MSKTFFVDSENVGDYWVSLLGAIAPEDRIIVFYTSRSPHMSYRNLIALKESDRDVTFIECYEGTNALDFQLCTELGYQMHDIADGEFIIVSNDMGFDAAVRYWRHRNKSVQRIPGKACVIMKNAVRTETTADSARIIIPAEAAQPSVAETVADTDTNSKTDVIPELTEPEQTDEAVVEAENDSETTVDIMDTDAAPSSEAVTEATEETDPAPSEPIHADNLKFDGTMPEDEEVLPANAIIMDMQEPEAAVATAVEESTTADAVTKEAAVAEETPSPAKQPETPVAVPQEVTVLPTIEEVMAEITAPKQVTIDDTAKEVLYLIGKKNLQDLHEALIQLYGAEDGMAIYNQLKSGNDYHRFLADHPQLTTAEKQEQYCKIVFSMEEPAVTMPDNLPAVVMTSWEKKKNLYSLRGALQTEYGKAKGEKYYSIMKAHAKMLGRIK